MSLLLRGRLTALAADCPVPYYSLHLATHLPSGARDGSAAALLATMPPHLELAVDDPDDPESADYKSLKLPYDLLIPYEQARADFAAGQLGRRSADPDGSVCCAHIMIPSTTKNDKRPERQEYWRGQLAAQAGRWVEVLVRPRRYSFRCEVAGRKVQRVGTRLELQSVAPIAGV